MIDHWAIFIDNTSQKEYLIDLLLAGNAPKGFESFQAQHGALFSKLMVAYYMQEEERHGTKVINTHTEQSLKTMSSGEQKKALLAHILRQSPAFIILDNPFDHLDRETRTELKARLRTAAERISLIQLASRKTDVLPFIRNFAHLRLNRLLFSEGNEIDSIENQSIVFKGVVPSPLAPIHFKGEVLVELRNVCVSYGNKPVLKDINWRIHKGTFWELRGKNGAGKTTILSMITGENPKGYGQELYIFGRKKGSGESVWDIKKRIGYFTPSMTDKFTGYHSVAHMVISGLTDSIGLYIRPTQAQLRLAKEWLQLVAMWHLKDTLYHDLSMGQKRLVMCIRAMIKHPILLILDEPTAGLDDASARLFVQLVNKFAKESDATLLFVSHREEPGLAPEHIYELTMGAEGATGEVVH